MAKKGKLTPPPPGGEGTNTTPNPVEIPTEEAQENEEEN